MWIFCLTWSLPSPTIGSGMGLLSLLGGCVGSGCGAIHILPKLEDIRAVLLLVLLNKINSNHMSADGRNSMKGVRTSLKYRLDVRGTLRTIISNRLSLLTTMQEQDMLFETF